MAMRARHRRSIDAHVAQRAVAVVDRGDLADVGDDAREHQYLLVNRCMRSRPSSVSGPRTVRVVDKPGECRAERRQACSPRTVRRSEHDQCIYKALARQRSASRGPPSHSTRVTPRRASASSAACDRGRAGCHGRRHIHAEASKARSRPHLRPGTPSPASRVQSAPAGSRWGIQQCPAPRGRGSDAPGPAGGM